MCADDSSHPRIATQTEILDIDGVPQFQPSEQRLASLRELAFEQGRLVARFQDATGCVERSGLLKRLPAPNRYKKFFGEFHNAMLYGLTSSAKTCHIHRAMRAAVVRSTLENWTSGCQTIAITAVSPGDGAPRR